MSIITRIKTFQNINLLKKFALFTGTTEAPPKRLGLCNKALYNYTAADLGKFLEYIELHRMLGVEKFFLYDIYNCDPVIHKAMDFYVREGVVELVPWQLPMRSQNTPTEAVAGKRAQENPNHALKCFGQVAALLDCIYSNMDEYEFLMMVDYDEFIIPAKDDTVYDTITRLRQEHDTYGRYASYTFEGLQFCDSLRNDIWTGLNRVTTNHKFYDQDERTLLKSVVIPRRVLLMIAHYVTDAIPGYIKNYRVPMEYGIKNHYRVGIPCPKDAELRSSNGTERLQVELRQRLNRVSHRIQTM